MPTSLIDLYYSERDVANLASLGIADIDDILEMYRPRGLFPNPNASALMINIVVLFLHYGRRFDADILIGPADSQCIHAVFKHPAADAHSVSGG